MAPHRARGPRPVPPLRLPRDPHARLRGDRAVRPRHRRRDRHRLQGDVHLRGPRRLVPDAAARGHGRHRARGHRAQPDEHRPRAEGLRAGADVPPRAAAEGALPAVPPGGRRGLRHRGAVHRRRDHRDGARPTCRPAACRSGELVLNSVGDAQLPARVRRDAARRRCARTPRGCARTASAASRPTRCACSTARCRRTRPIIEALPRIADHLCADCRDHFAEVRRELDLLGIPYRVEPPPGARPRLLHAHDVRGGEPRPRRAEQRARRRPLRRAGAATSAAPTSPASASPWGWSGW